MGLVPMVAEQTPRALGCLFTPAERVQGVVANELVPSGTLQRSLAVSHLKERVGHTRDHPRLQLRGPLVGAEGRVEQPAVAAGVREAHEQVDARRVDADEPHALVVQENDQVNRKGAKIGIETLRIGKGVCKQQQP